MTDSFKALNKNLNSEKLKEKFINFRKFISGIIYVLNLVMTIFKSLKHTFQKVA